MPSRDDSGSLVTDPIADQEEQHPSRRSVLRGAAGAGAAGIAAAALSSVATPALAASIRPARSAAGATSADADTADQLVVHVRDARSGQIDVFRGTSQTSVRDRDLAARLVRASRS